MLFLRGLCDEEVLLRNLASVHIQQKAYPDSGHRQLYCFVLKTPRIWSYLQPPALGGFFYAPSQFEHLTACIRQIKLWKTQENQQ